ncbi:Uncharacterised protein g11138 [Pycnogonum litorale]
MSTWAAILLLSLLQQCLCRDLLHSHQARQVDVNFNDKLDAAVSKLKAAIIEKGLDPITAPSFSESFKIKKFFVTLTGSFKSWNGKITGLSSLHREGDCTIGESIKCHLSTDKLLATYSFTAKLAMISTGDLTLLAKIDKIRIGFEFSLKNKQILDAGISNFDNPVVTIKGLPSGLQSIVNVVTNTMSGFIEGSIETTFNDKVVDILKKVLNKALG